MRSARLVELVLVLVVVSTLTVGVAAVIDQFVQRLGM